MMRKAWLVVIVGAILGCVAPVVATAAIRGRYCGTVTYLVPPSGSNFKLRATDKVYVARGPISCGRARHIDRVDEASTKGVPGWRCESDLPPTLGVTCKRGRNVVRGVVVFIVNV
jgi:hypothetical protein